MSTEPPEHRTPDKALQFESMRGGPRPSRDLEARTVRALRERGLIAPPSASAWSVWGKVAAVLSAAALLYSAGFMSHRLLAAAEGGTADAPGYMLLLWESDAMLAASRRVEDALVQEYAAWAREQAGEGRLLGGEKLDDEPRYVRRGNGSVIREAVLQAPEEQNLTGYFLIVASGRDEAIEIATSCPHLKHGGTIEVRRIDRR